MQFDFGSCPKIQRINSVQALFLPGILDFHLENGIFNSFCGGERATVVNSEQAFIRSLFFPFWTFVFITLHRSGVYYF